MKIIRKFKKFFGISEFRQPQRTPDFIDIHAQQMPIIYRRNVRARNYVLRLYANKTVVVTVPRSGSASFARDFVASRKAWLEKQWRILETRNIPPQVLRPGMSILFRGEPVALQVERHESGSHLEFGQERVLLPDAEANLRPSLERRLQTLARSELIIRTHELAQDHQLRFKRVTVRNQKSRWGSCSHNGTISLNWRLIQLPASVRDYIILHELMHLRQLNHSPHFWAEVEKACPSYRDAEDWLKQNSGQVGF